MNRTTQSLLVALLGGLLISITVTGRYTSYVKPGFGPLLLIAGGVLIALGLASIVTGLVAARRADDEQDVEADERAAAALIPTAYVSTPSVVSAFRDGAAPADEHERAADGTVADHRHPAGDGAHSSGDDAHGHSHDRSKAPWLVLAPILVLLLLAPPALGADAVSRNAGSQALAGLAGVAPSAGTGADVAAGGSPGGYAPNDGSGHGIGTKAFAKKRPTMAFPPLPAGKNPSLTLKDFVMRALYDGDNSVSDNDITVIGFVAPAGDGYTDGYSLARMTISCCAADASPMRVHVDGAPKFPTDTWVTAVVTAEPGTASADNDYVPTVDVSSISAIQQPADPYEH